MEKNLLDFSLSKHKSYQILEFLEIIYMRNNFKTDE